MSISLYPLASLSQIENTPSRVDGIPSELEEDLRAYGLYMAGSKLQWQLPKYSFKGFVLALIYSQDTGMGALYLASKLEECPVRMRDLINVYDLLCQRTEHQRKTLLKSQGSPEELMPVFKYTPMSYFAQAFYDMKDALIVSEMQLLKRLGFNVLVALPYGTLVNYLRVLGLINKEDVSQRSWGYLNDALQTPVYALYPVPTIVCAAILLTIRFLRIALPSHPPTCWWELFDANWEDMWSVSGYIMRLYRKRTIEERTRPMSLITKKDLRKWIEENVARNEEKQ